MKVVSQDISSSGQERHLVAADGRVWTHLRKSEPDPAFLERVVRTGCPLYVFRGPCPDAAEVAPDAAWDFWLAHKDRLNDAVGVVNDVGEWRPDPAKDAQAIMFEEKKSKARLVLIEFGLC